MEVLAQTHRIIKTASCARCTHNKGHILQSSTHPPACACDPYDHFPEQHRLEGTNASIPVVLPWPSSSYHIVLLPTDCTGHSPPPTTRPTKQAAKRYIPLLARRALARPNAHLVTCNKSQLILSGRFQYNF